jgi:hypothetical protein
LKWVQVLEVGAGFQPAQFSTPSLDSPQVKNLRPLFPKWVQVLEVGAGFQPAQSPPQPGLTAG